MDAFLTLPYNLNDVPTDEFTLCEPGGFIKPFYVASLTLILRIAPPVVQVRLYFKDRLIGTADMPEPEISDDAE